MKDSIIAQGKTLVQSFLDQNNEVGIVVSHNQSIDTMAAALALYLALLGSGKNVQVVSKKEPIVELSNLVGIDKVKKNFDGVTTMLKVAIPYREGEIEKVSYNIEGDKLYINLFGTQNGITFNENEVEYLRKGSVPTLIFTIGVQDRQELDGVVDGSSVKIVNIDNNSQNSLFGDVVFIDPAFSSISEIVAKIIDTLAFPLQMDTAQNLMDGISHATHNFSSEKTSIYAFEAAGVLMRHGARRVSSYRAQKDSYDSFTSLYGAPSQANPMQKPLKQSPAHNIPRQKLSEEVPATEQKPVSDDSGENQDQNGVTEEENVPSDWFVPKVFKSSKNQG